MQNDIHLIRNLLVIYFVLGATLSVFRILDFNLDHMTLFVIPFLSYYVWDRVKLIKMMSKPSTKVWEMFWVLIIFSILLASFILTPLISIKSPDTASVLAFTVISDHTYFIPHIGFFATYWGYLMGVMTYGYGPFFGFFHSLLILFVVLILFGSLMRGLIWTKNFSTELFLYYTIGFFILISPMVLRHLFSVQSNLMNAILLFVIVSEWKFHKKLAPATIFLLLILSFWRLESALLSVFLIMLFWLDFFPQKQHLHKVFIVMFSGLLVNYLLLPYSVNLEWIKLPLLTGLASLLLSYLIYILIEYKWIKSKFLSSIIFLAKRNMLIIFLMMAAISAFLVSDAWKSMIYDGLSYKAIRRSWGFLWYAVIGGLIVRITYRMMTVKDSLRAFLSVEEFTGGVLPFLVFLYYMFIIIPSGMGYRSDLGGSGNRLLLGVAFCVLAVVIHRISLHKDGLRTQVVTGPDFD